MESVGIDDASAFLARFKNGSLAMFEATRYARGHKALYTLEINGEHGSLAWDLHDLHRLPWFDHQDEGVGPWSIQRLRPFFYPSGSRFREFVGREKTSRTDFRDRLGDRESCRRSATV